MKVYLSEYWNKSCIFSAFIIFLVIIFTLLFCIVYPNEEMYFFLACSLLYVLIYCYLMHISLKLVRYVIEENRMVVMYSFKKEKMSYVNLDADVYYETLPLIEGMYSVKKFIILSNLPFESYQKTSQKGRLIGLAKVCKSVDANKRQVIMPYTNQYIHNLLDISMGHEIN